MKAKLLFNDKEIEVEISEEQAQALTETKKKTGYERVEKNSPFYALCLDGQVVTVYEENSEWSDEIYNNGNYYSEKSVAENNARADKLYRQLRRFAVENRSIYLNWRDADQKNYIIIYETTSNKLGIDYVNTLHSVGDLYFDSEETAQLAIDTFKDELIWYFTGYKDSL